MSLVTGNGPISPFIGIIPITGIITTTGNSILFGGEVFGHWGLAWLQVGVPPGVAALANGQFTITLLDETATIFEYGYTVTSLSMGGAGTSGPEILLIDHFPPFGYRSQSPHNRLILSQSMTDGPLYYRGGIWYSYT